MKISCLRTDLANAVSNVSRAVSSKAAIPALEGVLIKDSDLSDYNIVFFGDSVFGNYQDFASIPGVIGALTKASVLQSRKRRKS